jgi:hypothetical protein
MINNIELGYIQCPLKRRVTISKRKKGVFKKAIELSLLCGLDMFMCVFDRETQKISVL